jgi:large-conductance mechanosensitive channel
MTEEKLTKEELGGCAIVMLLIIAAVIFLITSCEPEDMPRTTITQTAPVEEKQATNNELMKEIKMLRREATGE